MQLGPSDPDELVDFQVVLRQPGRAELEAFLAEVADPASPRYHGYLSAEAFGQRFGLPEEAVDEVAASLEAAGLEILRRDAGRTFLAARGRVADVNAMFGIELVDHLDAKLGRFHVPDGEPLVPAELRDTASGTSAAAPFWAASMILVRQLAEEEGVGPLGTLGPTLYELAAQQADPPLFHDVELGGNLRDDAGPGWDAATGLGSPDVTALARALIDLLASR